MNAENQSSQDGLTRAQDAQGGHFDTTHWSVVLRAGRETSTECAAALEHLCRSYWYPLYTYCRCHGQSPPDAEDLTQHFFATFLIKNSFSAATPDRGRFRNFLLASFKNFLANEHHRRMTLKRGGRMAFVSLDDTDVETHYRNGAADRATPEHAYDHAWALTLLDKVMRDLKAEYETAGKLASFEKLQVFLTGSQGDATYEHLGAEMGVTESAVKMAVMRLRQRYGQKLRQEIAHTLNDPSAVEEELRHLVAALARR